MQKLRAKFPALNQFIYANTAAYGLLSEDLQEWRQEHDLDYLIDGGVMKVKYHENTAATKDVIGQFFSCERDSVALVPNFSLGLNILLEGLDRHHHILLLKDDYPSLNWPFERRAFQVSYLPIEADIEEKLYQKIKEGEITIFALSLIQWLNGVRIDPKFLSKLKEEFPELIIIADGTQFCGTCPFSFEDSGIDVFGASGYKWLLAGSGNGFMLFRPGVEKLFSPKATGFNAVSADLEASRNFRFSKHFEPGHLDSMSFGSLKFALEFLSEIGLEKIEAHNAALSRKAKEAFTSLGLLEEQVAIRKSHSTIFNIGGGGQMFQHLVDNNIVCSQRGAGIRLSFHFYNTESEIDRIIEILKSKS